MTFGRVRSVVVAAVVVASVASCGVSAERGAIRTSDGDVPFNLLAPDPTTTTSTSTTVAEAVTEAVTVYLVGEERLVAVGRRLRRPVDLAELLAAVTSGPTEQEAAEGMRSALPAEESVLGVTLGGGVATVELSSRFSSVPVDDQLLALAQIVYTVTTRPGVGRVSFTLEGAPVEVPRGDGSLTSDSVARDDYAALSPA
jgi:spore germination protein GerM